MAKDLLRWSPYFFASKMIGGKRPYWLDKPSYQVVETANGVNKSFEMCDGYDGVRSMPLKTPNLHRLA